MLQQINTFTTFFQRANTRQTIRDLVSNIIYKARHYGKLVKSMQITNFYLGVRQLETFYFD